MSAPACRAARPEDLPFVKDSWFESYRRGGKCPETRFDVYAAGMRALIERLVKETPVQVVYVPGVDDEILAWVCRTDEVLHYVYVKQAYRKRGLAAALVALPPVARYTFETVTGKKMMQRRGVAFDPFELTR